MRIPRRAKVRWQSLYNDNHVFYGVVLKVIDDRAIVDDQTGRTYRVVPAHRLVVLNDPTVLTMRK